MGKEKETAYIESLMARFIYLNELRVGVSQFFFAIATALLAVSFFEGSSLSSILASLLDFSVFVLFVIGLLVFRFDLGCRARASAVAQAIRGRVASSEGHKYRKEFPSHGPIDEDMLFALIVMIINSTLVAAMGFVIAKYWSSLTSMVFWISPILAGIVLVLQIRAYRKWPQIASKVDEWPDDSFIVLLEDK